MRCRMDVPVELPEGVNREAVSDGRGQGGPTGFFAASNAAALNSQPSTFYRARSAGAITKSGTNDSKAKARRGSGSGVGSGSASGGGGGGGSFGKTPSPSVAPSAIVLAELSDEDTLKLLSPAEKKRAAIEAKLHPSILAVVDRLKNKSAAGTDEAKFIRDGRAEVQVWLTDKSAESLAALKGLGFEVLLDPKSAKMVIGRLPVERLETLAELSFIRYVSPQLVSK